MNLAALTDLLVLSEVRVVRAQQDVTLQRELVRRLQRDGRDATKAFDMLVALERIEAALVDGRDRVAAVYARFATEREPQQGARQRLLLPLDA